MSFKTYSTITQEIVEVEDVNRAYKIGFFKDPNGVSKECEQEEPKLINRVDKKIKTIIYTDGNITKVEESEPIEINKYYINKIKYNGEVNQLIKKKVYLENATYIVKVIVADEFLKYENGLGHFNVIKDVKIFLKDKKDREARKRAKDTVIAISSNLRNYNSIWDVVFGVKTNFSDSIAYEKIADNVYKLKPKKQSR